MRHPLCPLGLLALLASASCAAPSDELFNGRDFAGWELVTVPAADIGTAGPAGIGAAGPAGIGAACSVLPDGVIAATGQPVGFIATTATHANYQLHVEWRWPGKPGNGGVLVHISSGPKDRAWPLSFQVQTKHQSAGDVLPMAGATFAEPLTSAPGAATSLRAHGAPDSEKPAGEWNTGDITCRGDTIEVTINGVLQNRVTGCSLREGRVGFQFEGTPFELRHVRLVRLD